MNIILAKNSWTKIWSWLTLWGWIICEIYYSFCHSLFWDSNHSIEVIITNLLCMLFLDLLLNFFKSLDFLILTLFLRFICVLRSCHSWYLSCKTTNIHSIWAKEGPIKHYFKCFFKSIVFLTNFSFLDNAVHLS